MPVQKPFRDRGPEHIDVEAPRVGSGDKLGFLEAQTARRLVGTVESVSRDKALIRLSNGCLTWAYVHDLQIPSR
jgi:hypothetical protein